MSKKYEGLARDIVQLVGGKENVTQAYHCQTRLRFTLADEGKADEDAIKAHDGVVGVIHGAGQFQVCIGPHVADVFEEVEKLVDAGEKDVEAPAEKKGAFDRVIDFVAGTFQPIIPALSGAGMVKAVMALLTTFELISADSQTYQMLNIFADGVFYFLPILLAFTEAQKLKCNPILASGVAAMLLHPNWSAFVSAADPVNFFEVIPFTLASYGSSVIPIILIVFVQSFVEKWLNKHIPASVNLVFVPMLTFLVMGTLAFSVLGPIGYIVGEWLSVFFTFLAENAAWVPAVLIGGLCPVMVMFGIHNGIAPLGPIQMADLGYDSIWGPGNIVSNMAQASAGLVVALRSKKDRKVAMPGAITAFMGITEPILYGTNLPKKYPLRPLCRPHADPPLCHRLRRPSRGPALHRRRHHAASDQHHHRHGHRRRHLSRSHLRPLRSLREGRRACCQEGRASRVRCPGCSCHARARQRYARGADRR